MTDKETVFENTLITSDAAIRAEEILKVYCFEVGGKSFYGDVIPLWEDQTDKVRRAWIGIALMAETIIDAPAPVQTCWELYRTLVYGLSHRRDPLPPTTADFPENIMRAWEAVIEELERG